MEIKDSEFKINVDIDKEILEAFIRAMLDDRKMNLEIIKTLKDIRHELRSKRK